MKIINILKQIGNMSLLKTFYYSFLSRKVKGNFILYNGAGCILRKNSEIVIGKYLLLGFDNISTVHRATSLRIDANAKFNIKDKFTIYYGGDIILFKNSELNLGSGFFNSNIKIRCHKKISIGNDVAISHDVTIMDSDAHSIVGKDNEPQSIIIEDHVWIGTRATILKGVSIGKGSIVAAGSVVTNNVPERTLVAGVPARIIKENILWK